MRQSATRAVWVSVFLTLILVLHVFVPAPSWAQSLKKRSHLTVVDAKGKKVGRVLGIAAGSRLHPWSIAAVGIPEASPVLVAFEVSGHPPFVVGVVSTHFTGNAPLVFVSTDCSGQPFMRASTIFLVGSDLRGYNWPATEGSSLLPAVAVASPGQTVYIPDPATLLQSITEGSLLVDGTCTPVTASSPSDARPVLSLIDLERFFTPPFSLH
jgi:hypothetical protein